MTDKFFKAIIFDLDGLILDSETTYVQAWQQAAATMQYTFTTEFLDSMCGLHGSAIEQRLIDFFGPGFNYPLFKQISRSYWLANVEQNGIPLKIGFFRLLQIVTAFNLPYCIATNSRREDALLCLKLAGIQDSFPLLITRDDVAHAKPAPDIFLTAAEQLVTDIHACLVLEDSPTGVAAAVAADAPCIYVPSVNPPDEWAVNQALTVCKDLQGVADFIMAKLAGDA